MLVITPPFNARVTIVNYQYMPPRDEKRGSKEKEYKETNVRRLVILECMCVCVFFLPSMKLWIK